MPISYKYKFKFIHIPKTGGTSIETIFNLQNKKNVFSFSDRNRIKGISYVPQHWTHSIVDNKYPEYRGWFSFTIVRNPYNKIISEYFWKHQHLKVFNENQFVTWLNHYLRKFDADHKLPQFKFITTPVDLIMRTETLSQDFDKLNKQLGTNYQLVHKNKSKHLSTSEVVSNLSQQTKNMIYNYYKRDFEIFNYNK